MTRSQAMPSIAPSPASIPAAVPRVVVGVDTHQDEHCAAVLDLRGAHLATCTIAAGPIGYAHLCSWATRFGPVTAWGVEGTGSYGAGLARRLTGAGQTVLEVNRADRQARHQHGTSDPLAHSPSRPARAVLAGLREHGLSAPAGSRRNSHPSAQTSGPWSSPRRTGEGGDWPQRPRPGPAGAGSPRRTRPGRPRARRRPGRVGVKGADA